MKRANNFIDLTGITFGRLIVIKYLNNGYWQCKCICGNIKKVRGDHLRGGDIVSCGCFDKERKTKNRHLIHDYLYYRLHNIWRHMIARCKDEDNKAYGQKGIIVCDEWLDFENFYNWSIDNGFDANTKKRQCQIDRINNNGNYEPDNCRFVTAKSNSRNKSNNHLITYNNETHCISEWAELVKLPKNRINARLKNGWSIEDALSTPLKFKRKENK